MSQSLPTPQNHIQTPLQVTVLLWYKTDGNSNLYFSSRWEVLQEEHESAWSEADMYLIHAGIACCLGKCLAPQLFSHASCFERYLILAAEALVLIRRETAGKLPLMFLSLWSQS